MNPEEEVQKLSEEIKASQKILIALGDEMRQHLILVMMTQSCDCQGMRVNDIAEKTSLYDLFGDKSVIIFPLHGHSAGMTGIRVGKKDNYVIIAGDGGYGRDSWE